MCNCMDSWAELLPRHSFTSSHPPGMNSISLNSNKGRPTSRQTDNTGLKHSQCGRSYCEKRAWCDLRWECWWRWRTLEILTALSSQSSVLLEDTEQWTTPPVLDGPATLHWWHCNTNIITCITLHHSTAQPSHLSYRRFVKPGPGMTQH